MQIFYNEQPEQHRNAGKAAAVKIHRGDDHIDTDREQNIADYNQPCSPEKVLLLI
jgi:hypothetical protein